MSESDTPRTDEDSRRSWFTTVLRWSMLRRVPELPGSSSPTVVSVGLCAVWSAVWVACDWWYRRPDPQFYPDGIPLFAWHAMALLLLAWVLRGLVLPRPALDITLLLTVGAVPAAWLYVAFAAAYLQPVGFWAALTVLAVYLLCYLARGLRSITGAPQRRAAFAGLALIAAFLWLSDALDAIPEVWSAPPDGTALSEEAGADAAVADNEAVLFEQSARIDEALESVHRGASPKAQAFFAGFAGVGEEKVFAQEIGLAARVLGERYAMNDNVVSLINDEGDLDSAPIASVSGLRYLLRSLATRMKVDRDVLFLAISSHGGEEPLIAVANSHLPLMDMTDDDLVEALHDSGIQWRVIIISACYAGGFIDALRNPRTIVITAAAADRTSFGCSSDSDLTYFGEAFYRDALPQAHSLREAFETAKAAIAAREQSEGETPSNPQAWFGGDIEAKLAAMNGDSLPR